MSIIPYSIGALFMSFFFEYVSKRTRIVRNEVIDNQIKLFLVLLPWALLQGFRKVELYSDAVSYWYDYTNTFTISHALNAPKDGGWYIAQMLLQKISHNPRFFMVAMALFFTFAIASSAGRVSQNRILIVILYVSLGLWKFQFSAMRQCTAIAVCMLAVRYIQERKIIKYYLLIFIAYTIHATAFIMIPAYFVIYLKNDKRSRFLVAVASVLVAIFSSRIYLWVMNNVADYGHYSIDYSDAGGMIFATISLVILTLLLYTRDELELSNKDNSKLLFYYLSIVFVLTCLLRVQFPMLERLKFYYILFPMVMITESLHVLPFKIRGGNLIFVAAITCFVIYFLNNTGSYPYSFSIGIFTG